MTDHAHLNKTLARARAAGETHLDELTSTYETLLRAAGRAAAKSFQQLTSLTAATNPWESPPPGSLVDDAQLEQDAQTKIAEQHKRILRAVTPAEDLGISWTVRHATAESLLASVASRLSTIGSAIREQVNETVQSGYENGWSVDRTAKAIVAKVDDVTPGRAAALARTDLNAIANGSSVAMAREVGADSKTWLATEDEHTRETHAEADGQTVPIDQPFTVGGEQCDYPGDPDLSDEESFNCRCSVIYGEPLTAASTAEGGEMDTVEETPAASEMATNPLEGLTATELRDLSARAIERADDLERVNLILSEIELTAAANGNPTAWRATLLVEDEITEDGRLLLPDSISWRQLPLTLGLMLETPHSSETAAPTCGRIDMIWRAGAAIQASGVFTDNSDDPELAATGAQAVAAITDRVIRGISVDLAVLDGETIFIPDYDAAGEDELPPDVDENLSPIVVDGQPAEIIEVIDEPEGRYVWAVREGVIGSACVVPFPAIAQAVIEVVTAAGGVQIMRATRSLFEDCGCDETLVAVSLVAAVAPLEPPKDWFEEPRLDKPTPLTVTDDGRVYGHAALWDTCHEGFPGRCVPTPRSRTGYRKFHNGELRVADGGRINVGKITLAAGHASTRGISEEQARAHYDNTATVAAFVRAGEDRHGIWVSGALKSNLAPEHVRDLMANPLSGDWRNGEMIAAHAVIDPGFPVLRASGFGDLFDEEEPDGPASPLEYLRPKAIV